MDIKKLERDFQSNLVVNNDLQELNAFKLAVEKSKREKHIIEEINNIKKELEKINSILKGNGLINV